MDKETPELMKPILCFKTVHLSKSAGYAALQRGDIPFVRIAGQIRIPRRWVEEQVRKALEPAEYDAPPERGR